MLGGRFQLGFILCCLLSPFTSFAQDVRFGESNYSTLHPSTISDDDVVFRETLVGFSGYCSVTFDVVLSGDDSDPYGTRQEGLTAVVFVSNSTALEERDYQFNITVNGTYSVCPSSATSTGMSSSSEVTPSTGMSSDQIAPTSGTSSNQIAPTSGTSSDDITPSFSSQMSTSSLLEGSDSVTMSFTMVLSSSTSMTSQQTGPPSVSSSTEETMIASGPSSSAVMSAGTSLLSSSSQLSAASTSSGMVGTSSAIQPTNLPSSPSPFTSTATLLISIVAPVTLVATSPTTLFPTQTASFNCSYWNESASVEFEWLVDGALVNESGSSYSFAAGFSNDGSEVQCRVVNDSSSIITLQISTPVVTVTTQPAATSSITLLGETNRAVSVNDMDTINITCSLPDGIVYDLYRVVRSHLVSEEGVLRIGSEMTLMTSRGEGTVFTVTNAVSVFCRAVIDGSNIESELIIVTVPPYNLTIEATPDERVEYLSDVNLTCSAVGGPTLNYTWSSPLGDDTSGSVLQIVGATEPDEGVYTCTVISDNAPVEQVSITLTIGVFIMEHPSPRLADVGDSVNFTCEVSGSDPITYQWLMDGSTLSESSRVTGTNSTTLTINPVQDGDHGNYTCNVTNAVNSLLSDPALLTVSPRDLVTVTPSIVMVNQSESAQFMCTSSGGPGNTFQWYHNGQILSGENSTILNITMVTASNAGEYNCTVSNEAGSDGDVSTLIVGLLIIEHPPPRLADMGDSINFTCEVSGSDPITYQWLMDGFTLNESSRVTGTNSTTLTINPVQDGDHGNYTCNVTNAVNSLLSDPALLTVSPQDLVTVTPSIVMVNQSESAQFMCTSGGGPGNTFQWYHNGQILSGENSTILNITMVTASNAGEYNCTVSNEAGSDGDVSTLIVGLFIMEHPSPQLADVGDSVNFTCGVSGSDPITYQWLMDGSPLNESSRVTGTNSTTLTINPVQDGDHGNYMCNVTNAVNSLLSDPALLTVSPRDLVAVTPGIVMVNQSESAQFMCTSGGGPGNTFQWYHNGQILSGENSTVLNITMVTASNAGEYNCTVTNEAGSDGDVSTLIVGLLFVEHPPPQLADVGDSVNFTCGVSGSDPVTYQWLMDGSTLNESSRVTGTNSTTLTINPVQDGDHGNYMCNVTNAVNSLLSDPALLTVSPRDLVAVTPSIVMVNQSESAQFMCTSGGGPGNTFQWYHNGQILSGENSTVLNITMVTASNAGEYNCTVSNEAGSDGDVSTLIVGVVIEADPMDVLANIMDTVNFTCLVSGSENITYTWFHGNGTGVELTSRTAGVSSPTLTISPVVSSDFGEYFCTASNNVNSVQSRSALLTVSPLGTVNVSPAALVANESDVVNLSCAAEGGPNNTLMWLFDGTPINSSAFLTVTVSTAVDGGVYSCQVSNDAGSGSNSGRVFVNPVVMTNPIGANVPVLTNYTVECEVRGSSPPTIFWFQNGTAINATSDERFTVVMTTTRVLARSELTIVNATFEDSGLYQCVGRPDFPGGTPVGSDQVNITVQGIPERPIDVSVVNVTHNSAQLEWVEPHDNNAEITGYSVLVRDLTNMTFHSNQNTTGAVEMLTVTGLSPFTNYSFVVVAVNSLGNSPPSEPVVNRTDEFFPTAPLNLTEVSTTSDSIFVTWSPPSSPNGVLLSYEVSHRRADGNVFTRLSVSPSMTTANLTSLSSFIIYVIFVHAETSVGFGPMSSLISVRTDTSEPGPVSNIVVANTSSTSVRITFDEPVPPNGIITQYQVIVVRASQHRDRRALVENVTVTAPTSTHNLTNDTREVNIGGFLEFSENTVCLRAFTFVGPGENVCTTFVTAEDTPLAPLNLQVLNVSSTSLNVTWNRPESIRGVLIAYEIVYVSSEGASQAVNITNFSATNAEVLGGLTINTEYNVTLRAFTRAGPGIPITAQGFTNEDAPPVIGNVQVNQMLSNDGNLELSWDPPSTRNGEYRYELFYSFVSSFSHASRVEMNSSDRIILNRLDDLGPRTMFVISNSTSSRVRSYASYQFSIMGCNILFGTCNMAVNSSLITHITRATPVTELMAVPMVTDNPQSFNIKVSWDLPEFPNGPIDMYQVKYFPSDAPSNSRMEEVAVGNGPVSYVIMTTTPFTNYTITIMPIGQTTNGFENTIVQRTNQSAPMSVDNLADTASDYRCITVTVPVPTEDSGIIRQFDVIVTLQPTNPTSNRTVCNLSLSLAHRRDLTIVSDQPNPGAVPNQVAANQRRTICELDPNTAYYVFTRTEYFQDGTMDNVVCSEPSMLMTLNESLVAGLVIFFFILIAVIVVLVIVIILLMYRRKRKDVYSPSDIPLSPTETEKEQVFVNLAIPQWTATMDPVSVKDFPGHVRHLHADDDYRFSEEYKNVEPEHSPTTEAFSNPVNATKNRYGNITAYDHSRVRLTPVEGVAGSDYINANFLDGYKMPSAYIATQGTVPDSISDFWRMVWEYNAPTIIMLTNLEERGRVKCHKYWPSKTDSYGDIRVTLQDEVVLTEYTVRTYSVIKSGHREERIIKQYHYTSWPDFGVPSHPTPLLTFVRRVSANHPTDKGPMVVHCSAGVGRSGTFITVHSQLKRIAAEGNIDIYGFVRAMRYRRCLMVQTEAQYIFIHDALLEAVECGVTEIQARDLPSHYKKLQTTDESTGKTLLELELQRLNASIHKKPQQSEGTKPANRGKNRFADILPYDTTRCRLSSVIGVAGSDYINANFINGYTMKNAFIATQGPLPDTIADFWRMVWEYKCHTVIMLTKEKESGRVRCHKYWPDGNDMYGQLQVVQLTETPYSEYVLREFKLIDTKDKSSLPVKHFQFLGWPEESGKVPSHGADLIDLIGQVQKWQRTAGTAPVIVHCSGGSGRTGTFITIANLLDCLKSEGVVDVFQTVRTLRLQRPNMVRTVEQYRYCYTTVLEYLESFDLYANFK